MDSISDQTDTPHPSATASVPAEKVWKMLDSIDVAMLVTRHQGGLRGRPMSTIAKPEEALIYILTESDSSAAQDIRGDGTVFLSYQGSGDHVAMEARATVSPDKALAKELWNPGAKTFWPDGPDAHDVVTLVIDPGRADVWDGPGLLRGIAEVVKGAVQGRSPALGARDEVKL